jgi:hypothetical protein
MINTNFLYEACHDRFARYALAVEPAGTACSMVLLHRDGDDPKFFILTADHYEGQPSYSVRSWRSPGGARIGPADGSLVPEVFANAIVHGVPVPRNGSFFGWDDGGTIRALIAFYTEYTPQSPVPSWATMPRAGIPDIQWPQFTDEALLGRWFWEHYQDRRIISLDSLIAATPGVVFWVDTGAVLGSDCCVVAHDIKSHAGPTLERGRYVYYQALRAGKPVPSLRVLLSETGKIDLASRLRRSGHDEDGRQLRRPVASDS